MGKSINAMGSSETAPRLIASMSLQLVIPGRVALQQSPLVLHQPRRLSNEGCHLNSKNHLTASVTIPNCLTLGVQSRMVGLACCYNIALLLCYTALLFGF